MSGRAGMAVAGSVLVAALGVGALFVVPSDASLTPADNCAVIATVRPGNVRIEPARDDGPFTVPLDGRVDWLATLTDVDESGEPVGAPRPAEPRAFRGELAVVAPGGFDDLLEGLLEFRSWSNPRARRVADGGTERYELPSWTPRGVDIPVRGVQRDPLGGCRGEITVRVAGGRFDSPLAWVAVGGTIFWLGALLLAGKLRDEPHRFFCVGTVIPAFLFGWLLALARSNSGSTSILYGLVFAAAALVVPLVLNRQAWARDFWGGHPALGWVAGFLLGLFVSLDLFVFGLVGLDSIGLIIPPLLGIAAGLGIAWWTPFHGREYA